MTLTNAPRLGADLLLECLIRHGVNVVFAYPGGATLPIHQALTRVRDRLRTILPRHEQGGGFAASGYARSSGKVGVCFATSGPGATNLVTCLADAQREGVPMLAITGQVNHGVLGTDAFQEIPIVSVCRAITKHHYLVLRAEDIPRVVKEALHIATTGRPGPVIIDVPKDLQARRVSVDDDPSVDLPGYRPERWQPAADGPVIDSAEPLRPHPVLKRLWQLVRDRRSLDDTFVTTGPGPQQAWVARSWSFPQPGNWITTSSMGALGFGLSAALGVQAAHPDKRVIAVDTPARFLTNVQELACAFCEKLPVKVLLVHARPTQSAEMEPSADFLMLARGFRTGARRVTSADEVTAGLQEMLDSPGPFVLDVPIPHSDDESPASASRQRTGRVVSA